MQNTIEQVKQAKTQRTALLEALYDLYVAGGRGLHEDLWLEDAAGKAGLSTWDEIFAVTAYLAEKKWIEWGPSQSGQITARLTVRGIDFVEKNRLPSPKANRNSPAKPTTINVYGDVNGGIQANNSNCTQTVTSSSVVTIDQSVKELRLLIEKSSIGELDKEDAVQALERLQQLAQKPKSADVVARAKEKLELVKTTLETAKGIYELASPYLQMLGAHFCS